LWGYELLGNMSCLSRGVVDACGGGVKGKHIFGRRRERDSKTTQREG